MREAHIELGKLVKDYRLKAEMTQFELSQKLGYESTQFVSLFERGLSKVPMNVLGQLVVILGLPEKEVVKALVSAYETHVRKEIVDGKRTARG